MDKHESLVKEFQSLGPPIFSGSSDIAVAEEWFREIEKKLGLMRLTDEERLILATSMLKGEASHWWDINRHTMVVEEGMTWRQFEDSFLQTYYPFSERNMKKIELLRLARMEYLNSLEKKRDKGEPKSSETSGAVEMENLESNEIGGDVRMCSKLKEQVLQDGAPQEIDDVRMCSPLRKRDQQALQDGAAQEIGDVRMCRSLRKPEQRAQQAIQDVVPKEIVVRNLTMDGGQGTIESSNLNSETHLQLQRKQPKPEVAVVEVSSKIKKTRKQQQPLALVESNVKEQKQQQPLALVESNVKEQKQHHIQQQPEVAAVGGTTDMIETHQQPEVARVESNIEEQQRKLQLQKKHYIHRVLLQQVQQLLQRKQQRLQPEHWKQLRLEHWKQLRHWQQLQQRQEQLHQQIQQQQLQQQKQQLQQQQQQQQLQQQLQLQQQMQWQQQQQELQQHMQRQQHQELQQLHQQRQQHQQKQHQLQQLHQQRQQQQQEQQQQQKQQEHQNPQNERKQNKKRTHHAEVALVQVNMEEFWANELNRKKAIKVKKQVQIVGKHHRHHPYTKPQQAPR